MEEWVPEGEEGPKAAAKLKRLEPHEWLVDGDPSAPEIATSNGDKQPKKQVEPVERDPGEIETEPAPKSAFSRLADDVEDRMRLIERRVELATASIRELTRDPGSNDRLERR